MKKQLPFAFAFYALSICFSIKSSAQQGFYIGAQGAPLLTVKFNGQEVRKDGMDYVAKASQTFGITAGYGITPMLGIGAEVMFSNENQRYQDRVVKYDERLRFIKIPVVATFNSNPEARVMFTAKAGPQLGILLDSRISDASNSSLNGNTKDKYHQLHLGAMFGTGARIRLANRLYADAGVRLDGAITNLENNSRSSSFRGKTHTINAGLEAGVRYHL